MWIPCNPNPKRKEVPDCVIRAVAIALKKSWYEVYDALCLLGREEADVPNDGPVWGLFLRRMGFRPFLLPESCPSCVTVRAFCDMFPMGTYIIGTGSHAVTVIGGDYYDSWDSGDEVPSFFWEKPLRKREDEQWLMLTDR